MQLWEQIYRYFLKINFKNVKETFLLQEYFEIINGFPFNSKHYNKNGKPIITIKNISNDIYLTKLNECNYINVIPEALSNEQIINKGDILSSLTGDAGFKTCISNIDNAVLNQRNIKYKSLKNLNELYLFHFFKLKSSLEVINKQALGAQKNISIKNIYNLEIPLINNYEKFMNSSNKIILFLDKMKKKLNLVIESKKYYLKKMFV